MKLLLMVVEDDPDTLDILEYVLKNDGHEVVSSADGSIILDAGHLKPDVIFLDEWLGNERGSDLCRRLKANPVTAAIPVIILSALPAIDGIVKQAGADGYIQKPFDLDEISRTIYRFTRK